MLASIAKKIFGTKNERELKAITPIIQKINALEASIKPLSNQQLQAKTQEFKSRLANGEHLDALLPEAFAVVRESAWRVLGQRHYDVQLIGGIALHRGKIAEMRTGEGKTLVATLPVYLNALTGQGVHVITVNDYLARRDANWMGSVYSFLGLKTGVIVHGLSDQERQQSYGSDITYGTNNEFGFDYLRDNMKFRLEDYVQRTLNFCIVDEVDSILIDEARTPLIISGPTEDSTDKYEIINRIIPQLRQETHFSIEEKTKTIALNEEGIAKVEELLKIQNLYDPTNIEILHHVHQALKAHHLFKLDVDYMIRDGKVVIVDEFTGRIMPGRRWSDGLHQAIEAKEKVDIENENQTLASITFQNYFRMYKKLAGMTGTADTEAVEFRSIYNLDVLVIPTNKPIRRADRDDAIYRDEESKYNAIIAEIKKATQRKQPALVGTISIEKSERIANLLKRVGVPYNVLNAKHHEREAEIIAQAGRPGAVTIATNMAGRGTDILLGGNPEFLAKAKVAEDAPEYPDILKKFQEQCAKEREEVLAAGGLYIIGTERHESRRIDNQLRGRAGRQGDPGESRFFLSLEDDLFRIFGGDRIKTMMGASFPPDEPIEHRWLSRAIENAQKKVEGHNYDIRKHLLKYDDVMNMQRKVIYGLRKEILSNETQQALFEEFIEFLCTGLATDYGDDRRPIQEWNFSELNHTLQSVFLKPIAVASADVEQHNIAGLQDTLFKKLLLELNKKAQELGPYRTEIEKMLTLSTIDHLWKDHLLQMDHLREGIGLRGYAQKDPLLEYKKESFLMFKNMDAQIKQEVITKILNVQLRENQEESTIERFERAMEQKNIVLSRGGGGGPEQQEKQQKPTTAAQKVGRNDLCPCGSGKKYKKCHGR